MSSVNFSNSKITEMFLYEYYKIIINKEFLLRAEYLEIVAFSFHEARHAYQAYSVKNKINEPEETLKIWQDEFENYKQPDASIDLQKYLTQAIEIDAVRFTYLKMKEFFNVTLDIPEEIKKDVLNF